MMKIKKLAFLTFTHLAMLAFGFAMGIYTLPILSAPPAPSEADIKAISTQAEYRAEFIRDLNGSDALHWGDGEVSLNQDYIALLGELAPGPEYRLYLSPTFVETEVEFEQLKSTMQLVGDIKTFDNFIVKVGPDVELSQFNTVIVWCEAFGEFITAAKYR